MILRKTYLSRIETLFKVFPVVAMLGPRQCGKTTMARMFALDRNAEIFDLEDPAGRARLTAPMMELGRKASWVIIDEIQRLPELFEILRVLVDRPGNPTRFLILGSASPHLVKGVSESLAGRVGFVDLSGFDLSETGFQDWRTLWERGGFPKSYLAKSDADSRLWLDQFIRTFLERDIPQLGFSIPADALRRFWTMVAHYHGQTWNAAEFARSLGSSEGTARRYLDLLSGAFMTRCIQPWHENLKKRQVKAPKVYIRDSGILHSLLSLPNANSLQSHPKLGASWEGFVVEHIIRWFSIPDIYYWATYSGAELDLLVMHQGERLGFEVKYSDAPGMTKSLASAREDLRLDRVYVVYPGPASYAIADKIIATPLSNIPRLEKLGITDNSGP
ncbi:MAG: ATP-binding protein [Lentisphaerae bacterium]|nr:ATP-binding protein [Lentisphaerota bacterium]